MASTDHSNSEPPTGDGLALPWGVPVEVTDHSRLGQPAAPTTSPRPPTPPKPPQRRWRRWLLLAVVVVGLAGGAHFLVPWAELKLNTVSTDDAYVNGHVTFAAPRVSGQVARVLVDDNQRVKQGDLLVQLDKEPYRVQVAQKQAAVTSAEADLAAANAQVRGQIALARANGFVLQHAIESVNTQIANLQAAAATLNSKKATLELAKGNLKRGEELAPSGISKEELDQRRQTVKVDEADVDQAVRQVMSRHLAGAAFVPMAPRTTAAFSRAPYSSMSFDNGLHRSGRTFSIASNATSTTSSDGSIRQLQIASAAGPACSPMSRSLDSAATLALASFPFRSSTSLCMSRGISFLTGGTRSSANRSPLGAGGTVVRAVVEFPRPDPFGAGMSAGSAMGTAGPSLRKTRARGWPAPPRSLSFAIRTTARNIAPTTNVPTSTVPTQRTRRRGLGSTKAADADPGSTTPT